MPVLIFILISLIMAKIKGLRVKNILKCYDVYPLFFVEGVYIFFVLNAYVGNYSYVKYASAIQICFLLSLVVPLLYRNLYVEGIVGSALVVTGTILNRIIIHANDGKMPVLPTFSKLTGYYRNNNLSKGIDSLHIAMTNDTKLNFLGDYIDTGFSIMSIGDVLIHSFVVIMVYAVIKRSNRIKDNIKE